MQTTYKPEIFTDDTKVKEYLDKEATFVDAFSRQIQELFFIDNTSYIGSDKEESYRSEDFKTFAVKKEKEYVYVYYPWNNHLVKCINADDYFRLKTNRNQDLITAEEQKKLYGYKVAIFGMSVGSNIAFVLTQAGISKHLTLADFDELDTTNLNRILAGVHQVGVNKTFVAARRIYEDNPFAEVHTMPDGINEANLEELFKNGEINCVIEEIDNIPFKIHTRELAMKYKVPVVMITDNGDGVVLHVERYDLGHDKIFNKPASYWDKKLATGPLDKQTVGSIIMNDIVGGPHKVDPRMIASVQRVLKKELVSWSQLGSAAILGGVVATVFVKRIALGESEQKDIREHIFVPEKNLGSHATT